MLFSFRFLATEKTRQKCQMDMMGLKTARGCLLGIITSGNWQNSAMSYMRNRKISHYFGYISLVFCPNRTKFTPYPPLEALNNIVKLLLSAPSTCWRDIGKKIWKNLKNGNFDPKNFQFDQFLDFQQQNVRRK